MYRLASRLVRSRPKGRSGHRTRLTYRHLAVIASTARHALPSRYGRRLAFRFGVLRPSTPFEGSGGLLPRYSSAVLREVMRDLGALDKSDQGGLWTTSQARAALGFGVQWLYYRKRRGIVRVWRRAGHGALLWSKRDILSYLEDGLGWRARERITAGDLVGQTVSLPRCLDGLRDPF